MVTSAPTLAYFDPTKPTTVSADASSYGTGGVLLQESEGKQHPVAFCSRTLTLTGQQYVRKLSENAWHACGAAINLHSTREDSIRFG